MKTQLNIIILLFVLGFAVSCESDEYEKPDIALTPVYSLTNIQGTNAPDVVNIYTQEPLVVVHANDGNNIDNLTRTSFEDNSTETEYDFMVSATKKVTETDEEGNEVVVDKRVEYEFTGDTETGDGTLVYTWYENDEPVSSFFSATLVEDQLFN